MQRFHSLLLYILDSRILSTNTLDCLSETYATNCTLVYFQSENSCQKRFIKQRVILFSDFFIIQNVRRRGLKRFIT